MTWFYYVHLQGESSITPDNSPTSVRDKPGQETRLYQAGRNDPEGTACDLRPHQTEDVVQGKKRILYISLFRRIRRLWDISLGWLEKRVDAWTRKDVDKSALLTTLPLAVFLKNLRCVNSASSRCRLRIVISTMIMAMRRTKRNAQPIWWVNLI